jgi:hypothetical protein
MVDEIFCYWLWFELMKCWFLMLLRPMLFIDIIATCSYRTCTTNMLVKTHKRQFEERQNYYNKCKVKGDLTLQFYYTTYKQLEGNREQCNSCKGEEFKLSYILYYMHERLNGYGKS